MGAAGFRHARLTRLDARPVGSFRRRHDSAPCRSSFRPLAYPIPMRRSPQKPEGGFPLRGFGLAHRVHRTQQAPQGAQRRLRCISAPLEKAITPVLCFLTRPDNWDLPAGGEILKGLHLTFDATRFSARCNKLSGAYYKP